MIVKTDRGTYRVPSIGLASGYATEGNTSSDRKPQAVLIDHQNTIKLYRDDSGWSEVTPTSAPPTINTLAHHPRLAFDENARAVITYWQAGVYVKHAGTLYGPFAGYDPVLVYDGDHAASADVILFYLNKARDKVYYRLSSESYATETLWYTFSATPEVRLDQGHIIAGPKIQLCFAELESATTYYVHSDVITLYSEDWEGYADTTTPSADYTYVTAAYHAGQNSLWTWQVLDDDPIYDTVSLRAQFSSYTNNVAGIRADNSPSTLDCTVGTYFRLENGTGPFEDKFAGAGVIARITSLTAPGIGVSCYVQQDNTGFILQDDTTQLDSDAVSALSFGTVYYIELTVSGTSATARLMNEAKTTTISSLSGTISTNTSAGKVGLILAGPNDGNVETWVDNMTVTT